MGFIRIDKLRSFLSTHPPLVVFIFCIGMTAVAFVSFAYYIKFNNVKNIDVPRDWNTILNNATKVDFCALPNLTSDFPPSNSSYLLFHNYMNVSLKLDLMLHLPAQYKQDQPISSFVSNFNSSLFGYSGYLSTIPMFLTFDLFNPVRFVCENNEGCVTSHSACVTITAPRSVFPPLKPWPETCSVYSNNTLPSLAFTASMSDDFQSCSSALMKITHKKDERYFVYLTVDTKSVVHGHLMRSSYFLFIVIVVILLFGFLRGAHQHHDKKTTHGHHHGYV